MIKTILTIAAVLSVTCIQAQVYQYGAGEYPRDPANCNLCDTGKRPPQYYSLHVRYPLSSEALVKKANQEVTFPTDFKNSGFVTVRFIVNCHGEPTCYHIYQVDKDYKTTSFPKEVPEKLQQFVHGLGKWPIGKDDKEKASDYYAYLTFRIKNGKIIQIVP